MNHVYASVRELFVCHQAIKKEAAGAMMEVVLHDGAPNVGGVWASEAYSQSALVLDALKLATDFLLPNGTFVTKIFRSATSWAASPNRSCRLCAEGTLKAVLQFC